MNIEILTKLSNHLRSLPLEKWDFNFIIRPSCGTCGCALGALTDIDSNFKVAMSRGRHFLTFKGEEVNVYLTVSALKDVREYLGISHDDFKNVFLGGSQAEIYGCAYMSEVTSSMVADKIDELIAIAKDNQ